MAVYLLNNLRLDRTLADVFVEEVRASSVASCELSGSWELPQVPGKRLMFGAGRVARLSPAPKGRRDQTKLVLMRNVVKSCM